MLLTFQIHQLVSHKKHVAGTHLGYVTAKELCSTLTDSRIIGLNQSGKMYGKRILLTLIQRRIFLFAQIKVGIQVSLGMAIR